MWTGSGPKPTRAVASWDRWKVSADATRMPTRHKRDIGCSQVECTVFHQLHCLDLIRQYTYRDQYDYSKQPAFDGTPQQVRHVSYGPGWAISGASGCLCRLQHVDHCINSLRIYLQCVADVTPYLTKRDPKRPLGIDPDFNTQHKCRDFDKIRRWAAEHALDARDYQNEIE